MVDKEQFTTAMSRFPAAVTLIAAQTEHGPVGLMATAVCSLSADPPSLVLCINRSASAHDRIVECGGVGVSLIPEAHEVFATDFARSKGATRFAEAARWETLESGAFIYRGSPVAFDCRITKVVAAHTHSVIVTDIADIHLSGDEDASRCLLWHGRAFARFMPAQTRPS